MTSKSKLLSHIANHVEGSCLVKAFDPCRFIKLSPLLFISVFTLENLRPLSKNERQTHLNSIAQNPKNLYDFQIFFLSSIPLNLSRRRQLSYRNQSINLRTKSMDSFLYDNCLRLERVKRKLENHGNTTEI